MIKVTKPNPEQIETAKTWPTWEKEPSEFPWEYTSEEQFLVLEGKASVTPDGGEPVSFGAGDYVVMPEGLKCTWKVDEKIVKHYNFA